ncbi:hypothetical protein VPH35_111651 [Triticum aestivum]
MRSGWRARRLGMCAPGSQEVCFRARRRQHAPRGPGAAQQEPLRTGGTLRLHPHLHPQPRRGREGKEGERDRKWRGRCGIERVRVTGLHRRGRARSGAWWLLDLLLGSGPPGPTRRLSGSSSNLQLPIQAAGAPLRPWGRLGPATASASDSNT